MDYEVPFFSFLYSLLVIVQSGHLDYTHGHDLDCVPMVWSYSTITTLNNQIFERNYYYYGGLITEHEFTSLITLCKYYIYFIVFKNVLLGS